MRYQVKKILSYYKPYKNFFVLDLFFSLLNALIALSIPMIITHVVTNVLNFNENEITNVLLFWTVAVLCLFVLLYVCNYFTIYYGHIVGTKIERDMRNEIFTHYQKLSCNFYDNNTTGELMSRVTVDLNNIGELLHRIPEEILTSCTRIIGAFIIFFLVNINLAIVTAIIFLIIFGFIYYFVPKINNAVVKKHKKISEINSQLENSLSGMRVAKSFTNEQLEINKFSKINESFVTNQQHWIKLLAKFDSGTCSFVLGLIPITAIIAIFFILKNKMSVSDLIMFMLYIDILISPIFTIIKLLDVYFQDSIAGYKRFLEILDISPEIMDSEHSISVDSLQGNISFENVSFKYDKGREFIIYNMSFNIQAGEYVALVGASGAGKSTLCNLIPRFYEVSSGVIKIDENNIKNIKLADLRKNIGFVHQDVYLFIGTVFDNIKYGRLEASYDEVILAAKKAFAHEFIINLPNGYDTNVGQRGIKLSGGQRQRIAIARVFLKNPSILIFDEATSALDNESERYVQNSLEELRICRTTIVIAHRLSTIKNANRVLVLSENKIVEDGTHENLLSKNGVYTKFYETL